MQHYNTLTIDYGFRNNPQAKDQLSIGTALIDAGFSITDNGNDMTITIKADNLEDIARAIHIARVAIDNVQQN